MLDLLALPAFNDNYIWLLADAQGHAVVVDPGEAAPVIETAERHGLIPTTVLLTHHHADHTGGAIELKRRWPLRVIGPADDRIAVDQRVGDGEEISIPAPAIDFRVLAIPGHTRSHIAFYSPGRLFCGDTLFSLGCGRLFEGTPEQMLSSLDRLAALPDETEVCCGHEYTQANGRFAQTVEPENPALIQRLAQVAQLRAANRPSLPSRIRSERACNPFLRADIPTVRQAVERKTGQYAAGRVSTFAELRRWKDGFMG